MVEKEDIDKILAANKPSDLFVGSECKNIRIIEKNIN